MPTPSHFSPVSLPQPPAEVDPALIREVIAVEQQEDLVHLNRSGAHWTGHILAIAGTVTASFGGVATARALQSPGPPSVGPAVGLGLGAAFLHLSSAYAAGKAVMFDPEDPDDNPKLSMPAAIKWTVSVFIVPLTGVSAGLFAYSAQLPSTDPNKRLCLVGGGVTGMFAAAAVLATHAAGAAIKINGDLASEFGPYFGRHAA